VLHSALNSPATGLKALISEKQKKVILLKNKLNLPGIRSKYFYFHNNIVIFTINLLIKYNI
jgi:hypothetical protein